MDLLDLNLSDMLDLASRITATTVAVLIVWALMTERLVPKRRLDDCQENLRRVIEDRDTVRKQLTKAQRRSGA